jgi:phage shock protein C
MMTSASQSSMEHRAAQRLHRSASDRLCCGVCGGIAETLGIDSSLVRLAFVVGTLWGGIGVLLYVILTLILPVDQQARSEAPMVSSERSRATAGLLLVALGGVLLAGNMGLAPWLSWNLFWPGVLIVVGVALVMQQSRNASGG